MEEILSHSESVNGKNEEETLEAKNRKYQDSSDAELDLNDCFEYYKDLKKEVKAKKSQNKNISKASIGYK